ncbi:MAG: histidine kinase [Saprospiraceae bacterium]|nr:histidine kinase [Saprospiraceae bacterium]
MLHESKPIITLVIQRLLTVLFLICICCHFATGQPSNQIDSLQTEIETTSGLAKNNALLELASVYNKYDQYDSVEVYLNRCIPLAQDLNNTKVLAGAYSLLGAMYWRKYNDNEKALEAYLQSKKYKQLSGDTSDIYLTYSGIGTMHALAGKYEEALEYMQRASTNALKEKDYSRVIGLLVNMSNIQLYTGNNKKRIELIEKAVQLSEEYQQDLSDEIKYNLNINLADAYLEENYIEKGDSILGPLVKELETRNLKIYLGRAYFGLLKVKSMKSEYQEVIRVATKIFGLGEMTGYDKMIELGAYGYRASAYCKAKKYSKANDDIEGFKAILPTVNPNDQVQYLKSVSELYQCINQVDSSYLYFQKYTTLKDSISNQDVAKRVAELTELYASEQKENKIRSLEQIRDKQEGEIRNRNTLLLLLLLSTIVLGGLVYVIYQRRRIKSINEVNQLEQKLLSLQMNPHFIFNSISSIQNFLYSKEDLPTAIIYLSKFAAMMRQILEHSREKYISIEEEIEILENYIELQKLRFQNTFQYTIHVDPAIDLYNTKVPPLIAQPFVENAIEHGKIYSIHGGKVDILINKIDDGIQIEISDNGVGVSSVNVKESRESKSKKSLATQITKERLSLLTRLSNQKFDMLMEENQEKGVTIKITLPQLGLEFR